MKILAAWWRRCGGGASACGGGWVGGWVAGDAKQCVLAGAPAACLSQILPAHPMPNRQQACQARTHRRRLLLPRAALTCPALQRRALRDLVAVPLQSSALFAAYGLTPPRGVLLYGPPGGQWDGRRDVVLAAGRGVGSGTWCWQEAGLVPAALPFLQLERGWLTVPISPNCSPRLSLSSSRHRQNDACAGGGRRCGRPHLCAERPGSCVRVLWRIRGIAARDLCRRRSSGTVGKERGSAGGRCAAAGLADGQGLVGWEFCDGGHPVFRQTKCS